MFQTGRNFIIIIITVVVTITILEFPLEQEFGLSPALTYKLSRAFRYTAGFLSPVKSSQHDLQSVKCMKVFSTPMENHAEHNIPRPVLEAFVHAYAIRSDCL